MGIITWFTKYNTHNMGLVIALSAALALTMHVERGRVTAARQQASTVALEASNVAAERDSTRVLVAATRTLASLLGDSVRLYERRVVQVAQQRDALDKVIGDERAARYALTGRVDSLARVVTVPHADGGEFHVRQPPYTVDARLDSTRLALRVALDPISVDARVTCGKPDPNGIRTASVVARAPSWATITFDRLEQSPDLCASPALMRPARSRQLLEFEPVVIGAGRVIRTDGVGSWGVFVGSGVRVWM